MGRLRIRFRNFSPPLVISSGERGSRFDLDKIKSVGAGPNLVRQASGSNLRTFVVEDAERPASQLTPGRAFDTDLEPEAFARRDGRRQAPYMHAGIVSFRRKGERGRPLFVQNPISLVSSKCRLVGMLANFDRRTQRGSARKVRLALEPGQFGTGEFNVVLISDRNTLPAQVAAVRAPDPA